MNHIIKSVIEAIEQGLDTETVLLDFKVEESVEEVSIPPARNYPNSNAIMPVTLAWSKELTIKVRLGNK